MLKSGQPGTEPSIDVEPVQNTEGQQYVDSRSYLTLEISLARPMVGNRHTL